MAETTDGGSGDPLVEEAPQAMDISLIEGPPSATGTIPIQGERSFRYPNSGGAFYYGINITYKVGGAYLPHLPHHSPLISGIPCLGSYSKESC